MNWRDPPLVERKLWSNEHNASRLYQCYHCSQDLWYLYVREVWANRKEKFVRRFHIACA